MTAMSALARVTRAIVDEEANVGEDMVVGGIDEITAVAGRLEDSASHATSKQAAAHRSPAPRPRPSNALDG